VAYTLIWSLPALDDLDEIAAHIALDKPEAAKALVEDVFVTVDRLREHPESGRRVPELPSLRYREVVAPPCRIVYRRDGDGVIIVLVIRGERRLPRGRLR
jgi:plasmid stabilization system protein ParE